MCVRVCQARASLNRKLTNACPMSFRLHLYWNKKELPVCACVCARTSYTLALYISRLYWCNNMVLNLNYSYLFIHIFIKHITTITGDKNVWTKRVCVCEQCIRSCGHTYVYVSVNICDFPLFSFFILWFIFATFQLSIVDWNGCESNEKITDGRTSDSKYRKNTDKWFDAPHCGTQSNKIHV